VAAFNRLLVTKCALLDGIEGVREEMLTDTLCRPDRDGGSPAIDILVVATGRGGEYRQPPRSFAGPTLPLRLVARLLGGLAGELLSTPLLSFLS
jgi:hypothetical protein